MKSYDAILFDLNGTLINDLPLVLDTLRVGFKELAGIDLTLDQILCPEFGLKQDVFLSTLMQRHHVSFDLVEFNRFRHEHYWKNIAPENRLLPATHGLLLFLKKDYELAIITSAARFSLQSTLSKEELRLFDATVTADDCQQGKPHPESLLQAANQLQKEPSNCLYVGDGLHDALAARAAGMDFVGIKGLTTTPQKLMDEGALVVLNRVTDLKRWLADN